MNNIKDVIVVNFWNYSDTKGGNYGISSLAFKDGQGNIFYFSYETLIAFKPVNNDLVIIQNYWSVTTGKHLNSIDPDKSIRLSMEDFTKKYQEIFCK